MVHHSSNDIYSVFVSFAGLRLKNMHLGSGAVLYLVRAIQEVFLPISDTPVKTFIPQTILIDVCWTITSLLYSYLSCHCVCLNLLLLNIWLIVLFTYPTRCQLLLYVHIF